jgi:hypothetical protein
VYVYIYVIKLRMEELSEDGRTPTCKAPLKKQAG